MSKKSLITREIKRNKIVILYLKKRNLLINSNILNKDLNFLKQLKKLPRNSSKIRLRNRCFITGRPRGVFKFFNLSRNMIRELAYNCVLPGLIKASW